MTCPKCQSAMEVVTLEGIDVKVCTHCKGMWFDLMDQERLKKVARSEEIDTGDAQRGKMLNEVDRVYCPQCKARMLRLVDRDQPHIWYESCSLCYGTFFDAGEFKDYKQTTLSDTIKRLFHKERH